jgi:hypothetical protein
MSGVVIGIGVLLVVAVSAAIVGGWRYLRVVRPGGAAVPPAGSVRVEGTMAVVTVDLANVDPAHPAVARLLEDVIERAFQTVRSATRIEVRDGAGRVLAVRDRSTPVPAPAADLPRELLAPHHRTESRSLVADDDRPDRAHPHYASPEPKAKPLADRFDLPPAVRETLRDHDDPVALVAALLAAGGEPVSVEGSLVRRGSTQVVVLPCRLGEPVLPEALNHAYRMLERLRARDGIVVTAGHMDPIDVRRRERLAPNVLHAGPDGIQRMADAVAVGADPLRFVTPPQLVLSG